MQTYELTNCNNSLMFQRYKKIKGQLIKNNIFDARKKLKKVIKRRNIR